jgi:aspartyl-tRNA(Asn)/glutamyl-tRNA(Gln) amidotransferase subunit A
MSDLESLSQRSATAIGRALIAGEASATALTEFYLSKSDNAEAAHVFTAVTHERARREAAAADLRLASGRPASALDGVPVVWKDLFDLAGEVTTAASETRRHAPAAKDDARIVANAAAAGMVCIGKTNLTEFAYSGLGLNPHFGTPRNPYSPGADRIPGGSSSGTAVAVAANLAPCGIGTDTGGSVRVPAAFNGLVGFKTSEGRIEKDGVFALSETLDTVGPLARSVEDCIQIEMAMRGTITSDVQRRDMKGAVIFVPETVALDDLDDAVAANFEASLKRLERAGARIERGPMAPFAGVQQLAADHGTLASVEAYALHKDLVDGPNAGQVDPRVVARISGGKTMSAYSYHMILTTRERLIRDCWEIVGDRLIAMPTVAMTAPETAPLDADMDLFGKTNLKALRNTNLGNMLDFCGLALPNGVDADGMPTSFLLSALGGDEDRLLGFGLSAEGLVRSA